MIENTFGKNIIPENEAERLSALHYYRILDSPSEENFDGIARLATQIFQVPVALLSLVDSEEVIFKSNIGMGNAKKANRGKSLCALAVLDHEVTVFEDALKEPCLMANPNVVGEFGLRFYAGAPLITQDGYTIGTLCIIDKKPRHFSDSERKILQGLAKTAMEQIELRRSSIFTIEKLVESNKNLNETQLDLEAAIEELATINDSMETTNDELKKANLELSKSFDLTVSLNEDLQKSETRLRSFISKAPVAFGIFSGENLVVEVANDLLLDIWGQTKSIIGKSLSDILWQNNNQGNLSLFRNIFVTGNSFTKKNVKIDVKTEHLEEEKFFDVIYEALKDENGNVNSVIVIASDVTDEISRKNDLENLNQQLEIALHAGQLGTFSLHIPTGEMESSAQCRRSFGLKEKDRFDYLDFMSKILPEFKQMVNDKVIDSIENKKLYQAEYMILWPDDSKHWISASGLTTYDENDQPKNMIGITHDITDRKNAETQKDDFLNIASHELKTPVTSLKTSIQLLKRLKQNHEMIPKIIDNASISMEKLEVLINDLLNIKRVSDGHLELEKHHFNVSEMLNTSCNHIREEGKYNLIIKGDVEAVAFADEHRIDQVIVNFVNNAVKYAPAASDIILNVEKLPESLKISVTDQGDGISEDIQPFLFDRYYRADPGGKSYSGLGLGLYISAEIIRRHNGEIGVESAPGKGSCFWFTIPDKDYITAK
jgi:PAS domain S-box-containing protein